MGSQNDGVIDVALARLSNSKQRSFLAIKGATKGNPTCVQRAPSYLPKRVYS
jgi:hypothetical protein